MVQFGSTNHHHNEVQVRFHHETFNTVNNYKNIDMSLLFASMAMSVATPIVNSLIVKAINKWNDEIPHEMQNMADQEMRLIHGKCQRLMDTHNIEMKTIAIPTTDVKSQDFLNLQGMINDYLFRVAVEASELIFEGFINKDRIKVKTGEDIMLKMKDPFLISFESHMTYSSYPENIGLFPYDQTIECLNRITPSSMVCTHNSFLVRNMKTIHHFNLTDAEIDTLKAHLHQLYTIHKQQVAFNQNIAILTPRINCVPTRELSIAYGFDLTKVSNAHFFSMTSRQPWYLKKDPNISCTAIMEAKLGHSISVMSEVVSETAHHMMDILRKRNPNEELQHSFRRCEKGPWKSKISTRQFGHPLSLFDIIDETDIIHLDQDFKIMTSLIRMTGTMKKLFPKIFHEKDPLLDDFIHQSTMEIEKTYTVQIQEITSPDISRPDTPSAPPLYPAITLPTPMPHRFNQQMIAQRINRPAEYVCTCLDRITLAAQTCGQIQTGLTRINEIDKEALHALQKDLAETIYCVNCGVASGAPDRYYIWENNNPDVITMMKDQDFMPSKQFKNQLWYIKGSKLFSEDSRFYNVAITRTAELYL